VEEKKTTVIPKVTASEKGKAQTKNPIGASPNVQKTLGKGIQGNCSVEHRIQESLRVREKNSDRKVETERVKFP